MFLVVYVITMFKFVISEVQEFSGPMGMLLKDFWLVFYVDFWLACMQGFSLA